MLVVNNGNYAEYDEWLGVSGVLGSDGVIAAGACGKCIAAIDLTTNHRFCIKIVRTVAVFVDAF